MGNALRHVTSLEEAFREYLRVLRPGGTILVLEVTKPSGRIGAWLFGLYFGRIFPFLTRIFTGSRPAQAMMLYYWETMDAAVGPESVLAALRSVGFTQERRLSMLGLFSEYAAVKARAV
jgi:demethylmenaquinone methyltransferase/2-methoxy-6-polyprenyl-1,4-benzoquinol methylase